MEQKSKFLQGWERRLQQPAHKCSECGCHCHSWQVCPAYFSNWESVQGEHDYSIEELLLQILALALIWWQNYLHGIYTHFAVCNICYTSGHSCSKKRDCPNQAEKVLMKVYNKVTKVQVEDHSSDDDLQELFEQEQRETMKQTFRSTNGSVASKKTPQVGAFAHPLKVGQSFTTHQGESMPSGITPAASESGSGSRPPREICKQSLSDGELVTDFIPSMIIGSTMKLKQDGTEECLEASNEVLQDCSKYEGLEHTNDASEEFFDVPDVIICEQGIREVMHISSKSQISSIGMLIIYFLFAIGLCHPAARQPRHLNRLHRLESSRPP